jgi:hypothetical protein
LVNRAAACRCDRRVATAIRLGRIDPTAPLFARSHDVAVAVCDMERLHDLASLMRSHPDYRAPEETVRRMRDLIAHGDYGILN